MLTGDDDDAKGITEFAMAMPDAQAAIRALVNNAPEMPHTVGTAEHQAFLAGKDATIATALAAFRADNRGGALKHLTADDMLAIGNIMLAIDEALSAKLGVDVAGQRLKVA